MTPEEYKKEMAIRKKKSLEGRKKKQLYHKVKKETLGHEEDNFSKLYVVKTQDGWYKMFDNSAFVYAYELAPRFEKQATVYTDTDYNYSAKYGVVSIKNFEELKKNMAKLKIKLVHEDEWIAIFHLGYSVPPERINKYFKQDENQRKQIEKFLLPEHIFPTLNQELRMLKELIWHNSQSTDGSYWSSSVYNNYYGYNLGFSTSDVYPQGNGSKYYGRAVRCVTGS